MSETGRPSQRGAGRARISAALVSVGLVCGGVLGVATLVVGSTAATVFGFGWGVVVAAAGVLVAGLGWLRRSSPAWVLLPVLALVGPSAAVTAAHLRISGHVGNVDFAPADATSVAAKPYRIGLGTQVIDLRQMHWPATGVVRLQVSADSGRTVVALPHDRCIGVTVAYDSHASVLYDLIKSLEPDWGSPLSVYGGAHPGGVGQLDAFAGSTHHPVLAIHLSSHGGPLDVRDYPASVDPGADTGWPGEHLPVPPRPSTAHMSPREAAQAVQDWHAEVTEIRRTNALVGGPCAARAKQ